MGKDNKRRRKVLIKGAKTLRKRSRQHIAKASKMKKTPESRGYALKEARGFRKQARDKSSKAKSLKKRKSR